MQVLAILTTDNGKTVGVKILNNSNIQMISTEKLKQNTSIKFDNAIIDSNGFVRAKNGNLPKIIINEKPNTIQYSEIAQANKLIRTGKITLYHGSKERSLIPKFNYGRKNNDYGVGFYTTPNMELGKEWAYSSFTNGTTGYIYTYELDLSTLNVLDLTQIDSLHWIAELIANRSLNTLNKEVLQDSIDRFISKYKIDTSSYDIIIGYRADDSYFAYAEDFITGVIYRETLEKALRYGNLGIQVCIKSKKAFSKLIQQGEAVEVPVKYKSYYITRDKDARNKYIEAKKNRYIKERKTIHDFI